MLDSHMGRRVLFSVATALAFTAGGLAAEVPPSLRTLIKGARQREVNDLAIAGVTFHTLTRIPTVPFLVWPAEGSPVPRDRAKAAKWLASAGDALGYAGFEPRFLGTSRWLDDEVWTFELVRGGIAIEDSTIDLHWQGDRLVGLRNNVPGPIRSVEDPPRKARPDAIYFAERAGGGVKLVVATRGKQATGAMTVTSTKVGPTEVHRIVDTGPARNVAAATFTEYAVPVGTFPDQIDTDTNGLVWFSQPNDNLVTSFDPVATTFAQHSVLPCTTPDGMQVESGNILWTGCYATNSGLGKYDIGAGTATAYPPTYTPADMAIPVESSQGRIWVTDHQNNHISEFDPVGGTFLQTIVMPTPACWVVQGYEDRPNTTLYFTEFNVDQLAKMPLGSPVTDISTPAGGGPAFCVVGGTTVYFTNWNTDRLGAYDIPGNSVTEYNYPVAGEMGGPMWIAPNGDIVAGTRSVGYIMVFTPSSSSFGSYQIPTPGSGLKDGCTVAANGIIWFTETGANKLGKLDLGLPPPPVADFSGTPTSGTAPLLVTFTDLSTNAPTSWGWDFGDGGTSTAQNPTHTYVAAGSYTVALTATNGSGSNTNTKINYITVTNTCNAPVADFSGTPTSGTAPLLVTFTDLSTNAPTSWSWSFGDGGTSAAQNPSHTYVAAGSYAVALTAGNSCGSDAATKPGYITVTSGFVTAEVVSGAGPGPSNPPVIKTWDHASTPAQVSTWTPYGGSGYGANAASVDIVGGGVVEVVTGPGPGATYGPQVRGFGATGIAIAKVNYYAYSTLKYGVRVGGGDVDGDAHGEIVTGPGPGAVFGPHVRGWNYDGATLSPIGKISFFAYSTLKYGCRATAGTIDAENVYDEILTGAGPGAVFSPHVRSFNYDNVSISPQASFFAFATGRYGADVAAGNTDADPASEIVAAHGPDPGATADVKGFDYGGGVTNAWTVTAFTTLGGAECAAGDMDADGRDELVAAPGWGVSSNPSSIRGFTISGATGTQIFSFTAYTGQTFGTKVSAGDIGI
ncbi:MAG: PKD domain-containing protein [Acidobacteriota bacterium]